MAVLEKFEELECWKYSRVLVNQVHDALENCRDFGFRDQIQRASLSIMNNIAEGFGRVGPNDRIKFLRYSIASANEVRSMLYIGLDRRYLTQDQFKMLFDSVIQVSNLTYGFSRYLQSKK